MMSGNEYEAISTMPWPTLVWLLLAGFGLGLLFFGSLWVSAGKILHSRHPVLWVVSGFVLRMALVLPALYWLTGGRWQKLLACLAGFMLARLLLIRVSAKLTPAVDALQEEAKHAP